MSLQVLTANALIDGDVVYLNSVGNWALHLADARVFEDVEAAKIALSAAQAQSGDVVGAYLMVVTLKDGAPQPTHFREAFRSTGPSNRYHGKQTQQRSAQHV